MAAEVPTLKAAFEGSSNFGGIASTCPHCGIATLYQQISATGGLQQHSVKLSDRVLVNIYVGRCPHCAGLALGAITGVQNDSRAHYLWPLGIRPDRAPAGIDDDAKRAYDEARAVLSLSPRLAAVSVRRCLQRVIREKLGIERRSLFEEIEEAVQRPELSRPTREALDHVREFGNWGAHPLKDKTDPAQTILDVTPEQALYTIQVLEMLFHDLYELPRQIQAMNAQIGKAP